MFKTAQAAILLTLVICLGLSAQRIRVQGNTFLVGENPIFMLGANTPWNNWNEFGNNFNAGWWSTHFASMHGNGLNCTRVWISCNGDNASPGISSSGAISAPTSTFWNHVGQLFQIAQTNKIYLMIALISFDHSKEGNHNANAWRAMYKSPQNRQSFVDNYVIPFLQKFGDNPYFWSIDLGNELDWVHENDGVPIADVFDLLARAANAVHKNSEVLITLGTGAGPKYLSPVYGTNYYSDAELQKLQPGAYIDFYDDHYYDWMMEWFSSPFEMGPADWRIDDKPCLIGEYSARGVDGLSPAQCLQKAYELGWRGVMPWTSNGVDGNGSMSNFGSAFKTWSSTQHSPVRNSVTGAPNKSSIGYNAVTGTLQVRGVAGETLIEIFSAGGKRLFSHKGQSAGGVVPIPVDDHALQVLFIRGTAEGISLFTQRVICRR
ncbi:MAG: glycoside hydrolase family 18 protein [Chitinispirillaceae bacterium]|nr:glycoside hydrolase family 18 protein [Chitinispirillaceae bacterium]